MQADQLDAGARTAVRVEWAPAVDVYETHEGCVVTAEIAGAERLHIELAPDRRHLTLSGHRACRPAALGASGAGEPRVVCHRLEITTGRFERNVPLPCAVDPDAARANYQDGLLSVLLPKARARGPVRVAVTAAIPSAGAQG